MIKARYKNPRMLTGANDPLCGRSAYSLIFTRVTQDVLYFWPRTARPTAGPGNYVIMQ